MPSRVDFLETLIFLETPEQKPDQITFAYFRSLMI
jgi:hypothetical protein